MRTLPIILALVLTGCPKETEVETPVETAAPEATPMPDALPAKAFTVPKPSVHELSNGMLVYVVENHEVPLASVQIVFDIGTFADPAGKEGAAEATFDMLNEGAGDMDAATISRKLRQIGASLGSGADLDGASVSVSGMSKNLEQSLDIWTSVLLEPTFPEADWSVLQKQWVAGLEAEQSDPTSLALKLHYAQAYGPTYRGLAADVDTVGALTVADMRSFYETYVGPGNARILVGGDVDPEEVVAMLDARIGQWNKDVTTARPEPVPLPVDSSVIYFVHEPEASQSVVRVLTPLGVDRLDDNFYNLEIGNKAFGGAFVARINMNLREDKGWTYGARCFTYFPHGTGFWGCSTSIVTEHTTDAIKEIQAELAGVLGDKPLTADEIAYMQSSVKNGYPAGFETTGALLSAQVDIQRYGLPADWTAKYLDGVAAVTPEAANSAFSAVVDPNKLAWFIVGDREAVFDDISALGIPVIELDRDGNPKGE